MCLDPLDYTPPTFPTEWQPCGDGLLEQRQIGPKDFEVRYVSRAAADRAIARFAASLMNRPRTCDHCSRPFEPGIWGALCDRCSRMELTERELAERIGVV